VIEHVQLRIREVIQETSDSKTFIFENKDLNYQAGQFLTFLIPSGISTIRRAYSFCTAPQVDEYPAVTVKRVDNGAGSRYILDNWKTGDLVECIKAAGKFILSKEDASEIVLFAAGSGIVPLLSIMKQALHDQSIKKIHLFYSNRSANSTIFRKEILNLEAQYPEKLRVTWFFSDAFNIREGRINADFVDSYFTNKIKSQKDKVHVFACGPESFMYLAEVRTLYAGVPLENYHQEVFFREENPNHKPHAFKEGNFDVTIQKDGKTYSFQVPGDRTILSQAIKNNVPIPWSCSSGRCSTCMLKLLEGKVYLSRNETLTDKDLSKGFVLTCTAYPEEGPIILKSDLF
jgi:ring-1,2-phenylacetyl-CoA epoxidase subunit PaaE